jgi:hypothetical protein
MVNTGPASRQLLLVVLPARRRKLQNIQFLSAALQLNVVPQ